MIDFNSIFEMIVSSYNDGLVNSGDEFIDYYRNTLDINVLMDYLNNSLGNHDIDKRNSPIFQQKYFAEIFYNSIIDAYENGLISNHEDFMNYILDNKDISNFYVMTLAVIADSIEDVYYDMDSVYDSNKLDYAMGYDLDSIGEIVGCPRPEATRSNVMVTFTLSSTALESFPINEGTIVTSRTGINFVTDEDVVIPQGEVSVDVCCSSIGKGSKMRVLSGSIHKIESGLDSTGVSVTNKTPSSGGKDRYTDEQYRLLLGEWVGNNIKGSREAYNRFFSSFDGIDGYKLIPNWNGSGTLKIVIDPGYPYQLMNAYELIRESVCQLPDDITMWSPTRVPLSVYCTVNVDIDRVNPFSSSEKEEIRSRIIDAIKVYVNGDVLNSSGLGIGEDFVPYKLGVFLGQVIPEIVNISFILPSDLDTLDKKGVRTCKGNEAVTITDEEIAFVEDEYITVVME